MKTPSSTRLFDEGEASQAANAVHGAGPWFRLEDTSGSDGVRVVAACYDDFPISSLHAVRSSRNHIDMKIENSFEVPVPVSEAWAMLMNIEEVVGCLPGAQLGEVVDESTYKGTFKARIGPISVTLAGTVAFEERDEGQRVGRLKGQASDTRGRGGAVSLIAFQLTENAEHTQVDIQTDLQLSGALAQYGRGAGMVSNLAGRIIGQFAECLRARIERAPEADAEGDPQPGNGAAPVNLGRIGFDAMVDTVKSGLGRRNRGKKQQS